MEECVSVYEKQREDLLKLARSFTEETRGKGTDGIERPSKRRRTQQPNGVHTTPQTPTRATRSQSRMTLQASQETRERSTVEDSEDDGSQYVEEDSSPLPKKTSSDLGDGLVECPMCSRRMRIEAVEPHLDQCDGGDPSSRQQKDPTEKRKQSTSVAYSVPSPTTARLRLGALNYSLLTETALRKKLAEIGIPSHGSKPLMQRRHVEWMNLWNASCDSSNPMTKRELLRELGVWDRTQGRQIANAQGPSGVMAKDFDAEGWTKSNKDDFADLIKKAKMKPLKPVPTESKDGGVEKARSRQPPNFQPTPGLDQSSTCNDLVDLTSPAKSPLEQQQSQGSQMNSVVA